VKRRDFSGGSHSGLTGAQQLIALENDAKKVMFQAIQDNKQIEFDEDEIQIFQHCQAFYNQTQSYHKDFQEQKTYDDGPVIQNN
jgi:hypothetical protein